jgi:tetratricopeptide (TPR) repeat protein
VPGDDAFRFRHLLIRDAAYDALPKAVRAELHEGFAKWLERRAPELVELDEILGYHLEQAVRYRAELGNRSPELQAAAAERLGKAGMRAGEREDSGASITLLRRASALLEPADPRRMALLPALGQALYSLGRLDEAYATLDEAIERADPNIAAQAFFFKVFAKGHGESISPIDLERDARAGLAQVGQAANERTLAAGYMTLGWALYWGGRLGAAKEAGEQAVAHARRSGARSLELEGLRLVCTQVVHGDVPWPRAEAEARELMAAGFDARYALGLAAAMQGRLEEGCQIIQRYAADERERGRVMSAITQTAWSGNIEMIYGRYGPAEEILRTGWDEFGSIGERGLRSTVGGYLGEVLARLGRLDEAEALLVEAMGISTPDDWVTVSQVEMGHAFVDSGRGEHDRACERARVAVELADAREYLTVQQDLRLGRGEILLAAGRLDEARTALESARQVAARKGSTVLVERVDSLVEALDASPAEPPLH